MTQAELQNNKVYRNIWSMISRKDTRGEVIDEDVLSFLPSYDSDLLKYSRLYQGENMRVDEIQRELDRDSEASSPYMLTGGYQSTEYEKRSYSPKFSPTPYSGGFDGGSEVSLYGQFYPDDSISRNLLYQRLAVAKKQSQQSKKASELILDGRVWLVEPFGVASKSVFARFKYRLISGGVTLLINEGDTPEAPTVRIIYGYDALFGKDFKTVHDEIIAHLQKLGFRLNEEKLSRVDLQVTMATPYQLVNYAFQNDCIVSRLRRWSNYSQGEHCNQQLETLRGGQDLQICIYDKFRECQATGNMEKLEDCLRASRQDTFHLTRVEYRLKRRVLNAMNIDTVADLYACMPDLIEFLTSAWFRILNEPKIRGHENEQQISGFWQEVQNAFRQIFCNGRLGDSSKVTINSIRVIDKHKLTRQGMGCLVTAVASCTFRQSELTQEEFYVAITTIIRAHLPDFYQSYQNKRHEIRVIRDKVLRE